MHLDRGEIVVDELAEHLLPGPELLADLAILQAAPDFGPILGVLHPPLQPGGVVPEAVLPVPPAGDAAVGEDESEEEDNE
jgi:hypothetical protein